MGRIETQLHCTDEQVQAVRDAKDAYVDSLLAILKYNFPVGTKFRRRWLERNVVEDPTFIITEHFLDWEDGPFHLIADLEDCLCLGFKKLDSLGRPNGTVQYTTPERFRFWFEVMEK